MFGSKTKPLPEHAAETDLERVYHEIRQSLHVTGIHSAICAWGGVPGFLPLFWDAVRGNCETRAFDAAADELRAAAVRAAAGLGAPGVASRVRLGEAQRYRVRGALDLYHDFDSKLLLLATMARRALDGDAEPAPGGAAKAAPTEVLGRGIPPRMHALEMVPEKPHDERVRECFDDIRKKRRCAFVPGEFRTLALWPDYLDQAWRALKGIAARPDHARCLEALRRRSRELCAGLPFPVRLSRRQLENLGEESASAVATTHEIESVVPALVLDVALLELDWRDAETLSRPMFPAAAVRRAAPSPVRGVR